MDYGELVQDGGVFPRSRAIKLGVPLPELNRLLRIGTFERVRPGWYAIASRDPVIHRAVKAGGVLSCVSALARFGGVWIPPGKDLHVRRSGYHRRSAKPVKAEGDAVVGKAPTKRGCCAYRELQAPTRAVDSLLDALACATRCVSDEYLVAILDSVLHHGLATMADLEVAFVGAPQRVLLLLDELDDKAGSGTESLVRFRLRRLGIGVETQRHFDGVGWVDLLVGDRMIIECDSRSHHLGAQYQTDRSRDLVSMAAGRITVRLTYESVMFNWSTVEPLLLELIQRRAHRFRVNNRQ